MHLKSALFPIHALQLCKSASPSASKDRHLKDAVKLFAVCPFTTDLLLSSQKHISDFLQREQTAAMYEQSLLIQYSCVSKYTATVAMPRQLRTDIVI